MRMRVPLPFTKVAAMKSSTSASMKFLNDPSGPDSTVAVVPRVSFTSTTAAFGSAVPMPPTTHEIVSSDASKPGTPSHSEVCAPGSHEISCAPAPRAATDCVLKRNDSGPSIGSPLGSAIVGASVSVNRAPDASGSIGSSVASVRPRSVVSVAGTSVPLASVSTRSPSASDARRSLNSTRIGADARTPVAPSAAGRRDARAARLRRDVGVADARRVGQRDLRDAAVAAEQIRDDHFRGARRCDQLPAPVGRRERQPRRAGDLDGEPAGRLSRRNARDAQHQRLRSATRTSTY